MRKRSALHPMKLETQMKMRTVLELRVTGASYSFIADKVGCSQPYVGNLLRRGLDQLKNETMDAAERLRNLEILRLDAMLASLWEKRAETKVAEVLLKISERRSKLMGLDAPIKLQPELPGGDMPFDTPATREEAEERIAELLALARPQPRAMASLRRAAISSPWRPCRRKRGMVASANSVAKPSRMAMAPPPAGSQVSATAR